MVDLRVGLETARRALLSAQVALDTVSHNIANANKEGYKRQRVELATLEPIRISTLAGPGFVGIGADVDRIIRLRDAFLEQGLLTETGVRGSLSAMDEVLSRLEALFGEPGEGGLRARLEEFFNAWEELSNNPESFTLRSNLREVAQNLISAVDRIKRGLDDEIRNLNRLMEIKVEQVNNLAQQIAEINIRLSTREGGQGEANDLRDESERLAAKLAQLVNINTQREADGTLTVQIGSFNLVEKGQVNRIRMELKFDDPLHRQLEFETGTPLRLLSGELKGLVDVRDQVVPDLKLKVNRLVSVLVNSVNRLHEEQFGLDGTSGRPFFEQIKTGEIRGGVPLPADLTLDTTLDELGITPGDFFVGQARVIIDPSEVRPGTAITLRELFDRITQADPTLRVRLIPPPPSGLPSIVIEQFNPPTADQEIDLARGTSNVLDVLGLDPDAEVRTAGTAQFSDAMSSFDLSFPIKDSLDAIAAAAPAEDGGFTGPGDNRGALNIAALKSATGLIEGEGLFEFYNSFISGLGVLAQQNRRSLSAQDLVIKQLKERIESVSGVNIDEEAIQMLRYQRSFQAASRMVTAIDEALDTIINRMGLVGR